MQLTSGIYAIYNTVSKRYYIGQSRDVRKRLNFHKSKLRRGVHNNIRLQHSFDLHGPEVWRYELLQECKPDDLTKLEQAYLDMAQAYDQRFGYNIRILAESNGGLETRPEVRERIAFGMRNHVRTPEHCKAISKAKLKQSLSTRRKLAEAKLGTKHSEETRRKLSEAWKLRKVNHPTSEETRQKLRHALKGRQLSAEHKKKISDSKKARDIANGTAKHLKRMPAPKEIPRKSVRHPEATKERIDYLTTCLSKNQAIGSKSFNACLSFPDKDAVIAALVRRAESNTALREGLLRHFPNVLNENKKSESDISMEGLL